MTDPTSIRENTKWSDDEITQLRELAGCSTATRIIALNLGRSEDDVRSKAHELGISLDPLTETRLGDGQRPGRPSFAVGLWDGSTPDQLRN
ncbi:hypothetical protein [Kribbella sp. NBC_00889]|uniref:hypothetical protein n=1 Tax=Kribbella sp. NBC_00889 TaxID=2975974 RepID=UPI0038704C52|nr:hypothetical protein OG817_33170 [Kribbella sp. NBC_00889]